MVSYKVPEPAIQPESAKYSWRETILTDSSVLTEKKI
jgi:hypothetical protein